MHATGPASFERYFRLPCCRLNRFLKYPLFAAAAVCLSLPGAAPQPCSAASAVFGGGPFYSGGLSVMNTLRSSGFTTVILWCIHVDSNTGNLILNDQLVVANGAYVGNAAWPGQLATLKTPPTSVNRIEVSVGSWGVNDFQSVQTLMNNQGTNTGSILYRNFQALKNATGAAAVDFDDEMLYDVATTVKFGRMLSSIGYKVTLCPYNNPGFWQNVNTQLGSSIVDAIYLQCYAGGAGNDPASWNTYFAGLKVMPGLWCRNGAGCTSGDSPSSVAAKMQNWKVSADIPGGFMWLFDDMLACSSQGSPAAYAAAINEAVDSLKILPSAGFSAAVSSNAQYLAATTRFTLTNNGSTPLNWSLSSPAAWLSASSTAGSLAAHAFTSVNVALNSAAATNLQLGQYSATLWFTNRVTGLVWPRTFMLSTGVTNWPIPLLGWNAALLAPSTASPANPGATAFDIPNNYCFYQAGLSGTTRGLPVSGGFASLCDNRTGFQLGTYGTRNALLLGYNSLQSGTLTLSRAQAFNSLAILAASANGGGRGTLVLNFSNGSKSQALSFNAQDWFYTVTNVAVQGFGRLKLGSTFSIEDNGDLNPNLYQTALNLASLGLTNPIASITFSMQAGAGAQQNTAIFAISGNSIPPPAPTTLAFSLQPDGSLLLSWPGTGTLLEATNLSGPWLTNTALPPVYVSPTEPQRFYRVRTQ